MSSRLFRFSHFRFTVGRRMHEKSFNPITGRLFSSFSPSISLDFDIESKDDFEPHF